MKKIFDLGIVQVPEHYNHEKWFKRFSVRNARKLDFIDPKINDQNLAHPSRILRPGEEFRVNAYGQTDKKHTFEEVLEHIAANGEVLLGAHGMSLVLEQKHAIIPKFRGFSAFESRESVNQSAGAPMIPWLYSLSSGTIKFQMVPVDQGLFGNDLLLSFQEV